MKKTVQIVTVSTGNRGHSVGDLIKSPITPNAFYIAEYDRNETDFTVKQLLVLSDDKIQAGDCVYYKGDVSTYSKITTCTKVDGATMTDSCSKTRMLKTHSKIIASYPQLSNTLPLSKETIQAWIDAGTLDKAQIIEEEFATTEMLYSKDATPALRCDPQCNLLLEFEEDADTFFIKEAFKAKPSIPTDEEIEEKAIEVIKSLEGEDDFRKLTAFELSLCQVYFKEGYKQALKDLGHE